MKYMGSKARIAKHILPIILKDRKHDQWFVDICVGGANLIDKVGGNRIANDINKYLIALLEYLANGFMPEEIDKEKYNSIREFKDDYPEWLVGYAGVCCSYSGKWFGGFAGEVNTKGGVRNYQKEALANIEKQSENLKGIVFKSGCFQDLDIPMGSIVYCDIPYKGTTKYKDEFDHDGFWKWARLQALSGHKVFVSEYKAPYDFVCVWEQEVKSSLSANGKSGGSKKSTEKLFVHKTQYKGE